VRKSGICDCRFRSRKIPEGARCAGARADPGRAKVPEGGRFATAALPFSPFKRRETRLRGADVAAEGDERLYGMRDETGGFDGAREGVRPCLDSVVRIIARPDVGLDDAAVACVDRAEHRYRTTVATCVADVELATRLAICGGSFAHRFACATACATVSRSVTPNVAVTTPGRLTIITAGSGRTPVLATRGRTSCSLRALIAT